ncbi:MAG: efflux RND transporter permease subunit, partial [Planctomycetota bacterium]
MLNHVIRAALANRGMVLLVAILTMALGAWSAARLPIDVFPDLDRPRVVMLAECPGISPEEVETMVAQPIETAILGAPGVQ